MRGVRQMHIVACGSAYHVGMAAKYVIEDLARLPVQVDLASEFRYRRPLLKEDELVVIISQSGETADTLAALREAKAQGVPVFAIVNVVGSTIAREADNVFYTLAGPEIAVATTKAYSTQLVACYLLAVQFARARGTIDAERYAGLIAELETLPEKIERVPGGQGTPAVVRGEVRGGARRVLPRARGWTMPSRLEGSLKMKEVSYIHSEAYAAGELKHGTISLIEQGTLVISLATQPALYEKMISNMVEVKARGRVPDGPDQLRALQHGGHGGLHGLRAGDGRTLHWPRWRWCLCN